RPDRYRFAWKNSWSSAPQASAATPPSTSTRRLRRGWRTTSPNEPHIPALGSLAPNPRRATLASRIAPAHWAHGSSLTYRVLSVRRAGLGGRDLDQCLHPPPTKCSAPAAVR